MDHQTDVFGVLLAAVIPQKPAIVGIVPDGERFVAGVRIPFARRWRNNGVCRQALPLRNAVSGACDADARGVDILVSNVKQIMPTVKAQDLTSAYALLFKRIL